MTIDYNQILPLLDERTQKFSASGAPEGSRNADLFHAAQQYHWNHIAKPFAISKLMDAALQCGLREAEAMRTIESAYKSDYDGEPLRSVIQYYSSIGVYFTQQDEKEETIPPADRHDFRSWAESVFKYGEQIFIAKADEQWNCKVFDRDHLINLMETRTLPLASTYGLYCTYNPIDGVHRRDANVTALRHILVEFDDLPINEQWNKVKASNIPVSCCIFSGGKSLHFWVRAEADNEDQYRQRCDLLKSLFPTIDKSVLHPGGWSRLPFSTRGNNIQNLISLKMGAETWADWDRRIAGEKQSLVVSTWGKIFSPKPEELVVGALHRGCRMILGGPSKAHKSWTLLDLGISIATGSPWMGMETKKSKVLLVNMEIHEAFLKERMQVILDAKKLTWDDLGTNMHLLQRRGQPAPAEEVAHLIHTECSLEKDIACVIIDPIYKTLNGLDENHAGDIGKLMNVYDSLSYREDIAVVFVAHFAKGKAEDKESIDRVSGSGVFARDPDSFFTLTPHKRTEKDIEDKKPPVYTIESHLRHHIELPKIVVEWNYPIFNVIHVVGSHLNKKQSKISFKKCCKVAQKENKVIKQAKIDVPYEEASILICNWIGDVFHSKDLYQIGRNNGISSDKMRSFLRRMSKERKIEWNFAKKFWIIPVKLTSN
jgi:RecA-family ATPase